MHVLVNGVRLFFVEGTKLVPDGDEKSLGKPLRTFPEHASKMKPAPEGAGKL